MDPASLRHSHTGSKTPPDGRLTVAQRAVTAREEAAFAQLETEMGGRPALVAALSAAHLPKGLDAVLGMMADPDHDHESLGQVCALARVSVATLLEVLQAAALVKGRMLATQRIVQGLPDVAAAVMTDATPGLRECPRCLGARWIAKPTNEDPDAQVECDACKGTGTIVHKPDHDVQKTALKLGGFLATGGKGSGGGVNVSVLQATTQVNPGDTGTYDALVGLLDRAIYGEGRDRLQQGRAQTAIDVGIVDQTSDSNVGGVESKGQTAE